MTILKININREENIANQKLQKMHDKGKSTQHNKSKDTKHASVELQQPFIFVQTHHDLIDQIAKSFETQCNHLCYILTSMSQVDAVGKVSLSCCY